MNDLRDNPPIIDPRDHIWDLVSGSPVENEYNLANGMMLLCHLVSYLLTCCSSLFEGRTDARPRSFFSPVQETARANSVPTLRPPSTWIAEDHDGVFLPRASVLFVSSLSPPATGARQHTARRRPTNPSRLPTHTLSHGYGLQDIPDPDARNQPLP